MKKIYLSNYCVAFQDYAWLERCIHAFPDFPLGVELATSWTTPDFDQRLEEQIPTFAGVPVTLHAPFVEECTVPGSQEEQVMQANFRRACDLYPRFGAASMVMHTHEGRFPAGELDWRRRRSLEVLLDWTGRMEKMGISVTVENVGYPGKGNVLFDLEQFVALFQRLPQSVGCLIDIGHAMLNGWDIPALIRRMGPRIRGYHLNNNDGTHDSHLPLYHPNGCCTPKEMDRILRTIACCTPQAHLVLEYAPGPWITMDGLHEDVRRVAQMTQAAD